MSAAKKVVRFKQSEIAHLLSLIDQREEEGWYFGNRAQWIERELRIKRKLIDAGNTKSEKAQ